MNDVYGIVYKISNTKNGKCYIGITTFLLEERWRKHLKHAKLGSNFLIHKAIRKHGAENFTQEVLHHCSTPEILSLMETFMIIVHKTHMSQDGYNMTWGGDGTRGYVYTEEDRQKMSEAGKGRVFTDEHRKHLSEAETGEKNHRWNKGYLRMGENHPFYGKHHSDESKKKISDRLKGEGHPNYKYIWKIFNISTGKEEIVKNKKEWCLKNNITLDNAKYYSKTNKIYKGLLIERYDAKVCVS